MDNIWQSQIDKSERNFCKKFSRETNLQKKPEYQNQLGPIGTIFPLSLDVQRTHITMDFLKKTKGKLSRSCLENCQGINYYQTER